MLGGQVEIRDSGECDAGFDAPQTVCTILILKRKWWNWQTHHLEGVAPKGVGVQIPPSAPSS